MKRRIFLLLTALACMSMQTSAWVTISTTDASRTLTSAENSDIKSGTITWDLDTKTITFDNVTIEFSNTGEYFGITDNDSGDVTLKLVGNNVIKSKNYVAFYHMLNGVVTITSDDGTGSLTCEGDYGIYVNYKSAELVINNCQVTAIGTYGGGINGDGWNHWNFKKLTVDNADVTAKGMPGSRRYGSISWVDEIELKDCTYKSPSNLSFSVLTIDVDGNPYKVGGLTIGDATEFTTEEVVIQRTKTTGISNVASDSRADSHQYYTLDGRRILQPQQKGVYIHNGKKVMVVK